jgi:hypothetical protein
MIAVGVPRVHVLAWRDLDDPDAGGSEVHADHFMRRWAAAGLEITHRTAPRSASPPRRIATATTSSARQPLQRVPAHDRERGHPPDGPVRRAGGDLERRAVVLARCGAASRASRSCTTCTARCGTRCCRAARRIRPRARGRIAPPFYRRTQMVTPSEATRDELLELGFHPDRVLAVNNGVSEAFHTAADPVAARSPEPLVVAVGRLAPVKRFDELIRAAVVAKRACRRCGSRSWASGRCVPSSRRSSRPRCATDWITLRRPGERTPNWSSGTSARGWCRARRWPRAGGSRSPRPRRAARPAVATDIRGHRSSVVDGVTGVLAPLDRLGRRPRRRAERPRPPRPGAGRRRAGTGPHAHVGRRRPSACCVALHAQVTPSPR